MKRWPLQDRMAHQAWLKESGSFDENKKSRLFPQQRIVARYLSRESPYRGLLLYHGLGSGKSCAAIVVAEALRASSKGIVVFLPASLRSNFVEEVCNCPGLKWSKASDGGWEQATESAKSGSYFADLSSAQQQSLRKHVRDSAESMFSFFNYNASNIGDKMAALLANDPNYFDGKVVIVDEAHNFVSRVVNEGQLKPAYEALLAARLERIVLLSGTPIVNKPLELSFLINLVRGYSWIYEAKVQSADPGAARELPGILNRMPEVDEYFFDEVDNVLRVQLVPLGFDRDTACPGSGAYLVRRPKARASDAEALSRLSGALSAKGLSLATAPKRSLVPALPMDEDAFERFFIKEQVEASTGATRYAVDNAMWLTKRMLGCVSFHESQDPELFPKLGETEIVGAPMSTLQFTEYMTARQTERRQERVMKSIASKAASSSASSGFDGLWNKNMHTYRSASRMLCNFVFPKSIERPKRSKKEALFVAQVRKAMEALQKTPDALSDDLAQHSPKFAAMLAHFSGSPGTCLVYSEFRTIEGIGLLKLALDANGYQQLMLRKDTEKGIVLDADHLDPAKPKYIVYNDVEDKEINETLKQMFNSEWRSVPASLKRDLERLNMPTDNLRGQLCKLFMVTKSGAEGITLKNVRQVHLLEPFWHHNRITQVIGRAVRANSHAALPPAERSVRVFLYVSKFTSDQLADKTVRWQDKGLTSDEHVLRVSAMKKEIVDELLSAVRAAAIDCKGAGCFEPPANAQEGDLIRRFDMTLEEDDASFARNLVQVVAIRVRGKTYFWNKDTDEVYDGDSLTMHKKRAVVGHIVDGKLVLGKDEAKA